LNHQARNLGYKMVNVQLQNGGCGYGLVAFATALASRIQPRKNCFFKQDTLMFEGTTYHNTSCPRGTTYHDTSCPRGTTYV
jgi:hypothetical protein